MKIYKMMKILYKEKIWKNINKTEMDNGRKIVAKSKKESKKREKKRKETERQHETYETFVDINNSQEN